MKTRFFTTAIALMALTFVFNSCEKEDSFLFPNDQVELLLPDGAVVDTTIRRKDIVNSTNPSYSVVVMVGTEKDNLSTFMGDDKCVLKNDQKYYWRAKAVDSKSGENSEFSEIRTFYVLDPLMKVTMEIDNGENEIAAIVRWDNKDHKYKNMKVQMAPTKECGFVGKTFEIPGEQDSLYISLADNPEIPYLFNDFDDLHGKNYEPVVYNFKLIADVTIGDKTFEASRNAKGIFLNKANHVCDHELNVYRIVTVGDQKWLADDLRCTSYIDENGDTIPLELNKDYIVSELPSGARGMLYSYGFLFNDDTHLKGLMFSDFHYAYDVDWIKMEKVYGIDAELPKLSGIISNGYYFCGSAFPLSAESDAEKTKVADSLYADSPYINMWEEFASASDWVDENGNYVYPSKSTFNVKPFGYGYTNANKNADIYYQGLGALYYSRPNRVRTFFSLRSGIGHYYGYDYYLPRRPENCDPVCYAVRLVKDI